MSNEPFLRYRWQVLFIEEFSVALKSSSFGNSVRLRKRNAFAFRPRSWNMKSSRTMRGGTRSKNSSHRSPSRQWGDDGVGALFAIVPRSDVDLTRKKSPGFPALPCSSSSIARWGKGPNSASITRVDTSIAQRNRFETSNEIYSARGWGKRRRRKREHQIPRKPVIASFFFPSSLLPLRSPPSPALPRSVRMSGFLFRCRPRPRNGEKRCRLFDAKCGMHINW